VLGPQRDYYVVDLALIARYLPGWAGKIAVA
jgi:hypothetical protein